MDRYEGKDNHGQPKSAFIDKIAAMNDHDLFKTTKEYIWLSSYAGNNPRSDYHWMCDATYDEWNRRGKVDEYGRAHKAAF